MEPRPQMDCSAKEPVFITHFIIMVLKNVQKSLKSPIVNFVLMMHSKCCGAKH